MHLVAILLVVKSNKLHFPHQKPSTVAGTSCYNINNYGARQSGRSGNKTCCQSQQTSFIPELSSSSLVCLESAGVVIGSLPCPHSLVSLSSSKIFLLLWVVLSKVLGTFGEGTNIAEKLSLIKCSVIRILFMRTTIVLQNRYNEKRM